VEVEEGQGTKDNDSKGIGPITRLPEYIPLKKGKVKVMKDPDFEKFTISVPLVIEQVPSKGLQLTQIPLLKMEDRDLTDRT